MPYRWRCVVLSLFKHMHLDKLNEYLEERRAYKKPIPAVGQGCSPVLPQSSFVHNAVILRCPHWQFNENAVIGNVSLYKVWYLLKQQSYFLNETNKRDKT